MIIADLLPDEQKQKLTHKHRHKKERRPKKKLTRKELEELMGVNRDIYERRNGAIRRK